MEYHGISNVQEGITQSDERKVEGEEDKVKIIKKDAKKMVRKK